MKSPERANFAIQKMKRWPWMEGLGLGLGLAGCGLAPESPQVEPRASLAKVVNSDPRGVNDQPDWDSLAQKMRSAMLARMPSPLPSDIRGSCEAMLDTARRYYEATLEESLHRAERLAELESTRGADLASCIAQSSIETTVCVRLGLEDRDGEFPWLLDQCSRAFPSPPRAVDESPTLEKSVEFGFVGDIIFGRYRDHGYDAIGENGYDLFSDVAPLLGADILVANLETPVAEVVAKTSPIGSKFRFAASREDVRGLAKSGFDVVSLANNHYFDLRQAGQRDTPRIVQEEGMTAIGASREQPPLFRVDTHTWGGWKVAFLAVSTRRNAPHRGDAPALPFLSLREMATTLGPQISGARKDHDLVVVAVHWGDEYAEEPNLYQRRAAHALVDAGADLVVGHHPHVLQGVEQYGNGVIAYSMGNFLFENTTAIPRLTGVLKAHFTRQPVGRACLDRVRFEPAYIKRTPVKHPVPATGGMGKRIRARVIAQGHALDSEWSRIEGSEALELKLPGC